MPGRFSSNRRSNLRAESLRLSSRFAALQAGLEIFADVDLSSLFEKGQRLGQLLIDLVRQECRGSELALISPDEAGRRGSHVAYRHPRARHIVDELATRSVLADFRAPDAIRFGLAPLYLGYVDLWDAVAALRVILAGG